MIYLRQSTASQEVPLGPFLDPTDGDTEETGLTISSTLIRIWKRGATSLVAKNSGGATHMEGGIYYATLDATDTNTAGSLIIYCHVEIDSNNANGALYVKQECEVLPATVYDSLVLGTDNLPVDATEVSGTTGATIADSVWDEALSGHQTAGTAGRNLTFAGAILSETTLTGTPTTTVFRLTAGSSTDDFYNDMEIYFIDGNAAGLSRIITDYDGTNKDVTVDEALPVTPTAADAVVIKTNHKHSKSQIADAIWDEDIVASHTTTDTAGLILASTLADTNELQTDWADGGRLDVILDARASQTSVDTVDSNVDDLKSGVILGQAQTGTLSTTQLTTDLTGYADDQLIYRVIIFTSGAAEGEARAITDYANASGLITMGTALTTAPANTDTFKIV